MAIKGILFDKDGTLVDFHATWFAIGEMMALEAARGDRARARELLAEAGYDFATGTFRPDCVFAAGTNADIVALWYAHMSAAERATMAAEFDAFTAEEGAARCVPLPGSKETIARLHASGYSLGVATNDSTGGAEYERPHKAADSTAHTFHVGVRLTRHILMQRGTDDFADVAIMQQGGVHVLGNLPCFGAHGQLAALPVEN